MRFRIAAASAALPVIAALLLATAVRAGADEPLAAPPVADRGGLFGSLSSIFDPRTSPFIPIPEIGTDPNGGTTYGILPVFLKNDATGSISRIIAPDVTYNSDLGYGGHFRIFSYPSTDTQWQVVAGADQRIERELDARYATGITRQASTSFSVNLVYDRSATERFFGFGNGSSPANQTNYTAEQEFVNATLGWNITPTLQIAYDGRPRLIRIERGVLTRLPSIETRFPSVTGGGTQHELVQRLLLSYDTRDSTSLPSRGTNVVLFAGATARGLLSSVSYSFFGIDARHFLPLGPRFTLAGHAALRYMPGNTAPFWAQSSIGGDRSIVGDRQPLRGFGANRFVDRNAFSASLELRSTVWDVDLFATHLTLELAPLVDMGRVFHQLGANPVSGLHVVEGVGFRARASPFILGYVDIGHGSEGFAVFSGIDYAF
jgi:hypothetical protein